MSGLRWAARSVGLAIAVRIWFGLLARLLLFLAAAWFVFDW